MNTKFRREMKLIKNNLNTKTDIGWGHQIRSYVLQPYQLVKDLKKQNREFKSVKRFRWKY